MTVKKRGLGRGLEALLVDVATKEDMHQPVKGAGQDEIQAMPAPVSGDLDAEGTTPETNELDSRLEPRSGAPADAVDDRTAMVVALFKNIQREHLVLLEEAEALRKLIEEFEAIIRADLA